MCLSTELRYEETSETHVSEQKVVWSCDHSVPASKMFSYQLASCQEDLQRALALQARPSELSAAQVQKTSVFSGSHTQTQKLTTCQFQTLMWNLEKHNLTG